MKGSEGGVKTFDEAASHLALSASQMDEVAVEGIDTGKWTHLGTNTVYDENEEGAVTVTYFARVYEANTVSSRSGLDTDITGGGPIRHD